MYPTQNTAQLTYYPVQTSSTFDMNSIMELMMTMMVMVMMMNMMKGVMKNSM